jgi:NAD(P)-dependent dehydrogenase (short-subunit alcohol dehydrogenase family)
VSAPRFDFSGRSVLVTGASRGIGYAVAAAFAHAGAELHILADDEATMDAAERLQALYGRPVTALRCDIANREAVRAALEPLGRIDALINNAGCEAMTPIMERSDTIEAAFRRIIEVNVLGAFYVTRDILPKMQSGSRIVFTASIWGRTAVADFGAYCASKHAVIGFMRSLAKELGPHGISVNAVGPGWVRTEMSMRSLKRISEREGKSETAMLEEVVAAQALPGLMEPEDMVELYLFLASDAARNITGQTFGIDRGEILA